MNLTLIGHDDRYAVEQLLMSLFGAEDDAQITSRLYRGDTWLTAVTTIRTEEGTYTARRRLLKARETVRLRRQTLQQSCYLAAVQRLGTTPPWGALAGVRPTKISTKHLLSGGSRKSAQTMLQKIYYVTPQRSQLALECSLSTVNAAEKASSQDLSVYVGIPFCPTRCSYCSFVSRTVGKKTQLLQPYLEALLQEIALTGQLLADSGKKIRSLYIGGGTPTTLDCSQLSTLLHAITTHFDLSDCLEFTVEGGRPDTLSFEKLQTIRAHGADRMSINPQSMVDSVLRACGRPHSAQDVINAYEWAQKAGFADINMDLIAGLPTDTLEGFQHSLDTVLSLKPANITVHTLALKKGADLFENRQQLPPVQAVSQMVDHANARLPQEGYRPYYLYRQKYMSGSFENIGWSRNGRDCLYNIYMMEELHTILSLGGGGMNKINFPDGSLQRFHNPKFPEQYIEMLDNVLKDKQELFRLMKGSL